MTDLYVQTIGQFDPNGHLDISDPFYARGIWCAMTFLLVAKGVWEFGVLRNEGRVVALWGHEKQDAPLTTVEQFLLRFPKDKLRDIHTLGVDSGSMAIMASAARQQYPLKAVQEEAAFVHAPFMFSCGLYAGLVGITSPSGYGDGAYPLEICLKENTSIPDRIIVTFIEYGDKAETP